MVVAESAPDLQWVEGIKNLHIFVSYNSNLVSFWVRLNPKFCFFIYIYTYLFEKHA